MPLLWKRYYFLWIALGLMLIGLVFIGSKRIFSYNFGQAINPKITSTTVGQNISNPVDPFDDEIVHDIQIVMSDQLYQQMLDTYTELGEKEYFAVDVRIDGVLVSNVGVRLKGNSSLRGLDGGKNGARNGEFPGKSPGAERKMGNADARERFVGEANFSGARGGENIISGERSSIESEEIQMMPGMGGNDNLPGELALSGGNNFPAREGFAGGMGNSGTGYLPLMLKFDAFVEGQTYNGLSELSLRLGGFSDQTLLAEMLAYRVYQALDYPAPETSYTQVTVGNLAPQLYVLSELVNEEYLERYYPNDDGILYKNKSFYDFSYLGEDPSEYADIFSQKTNKKKDDLAQLIKLIKFVNESSDLDFEEHLEEYLDVDSVLYLMAIDSIIQNTDGFNNGRMNYYLYYSKEEKKFKILTWDQNLAFGGLGGGGGFGGERVGENAFPGIQEIDFARDGAFSGENIIQRDEKNQPGFENGFEPFENARREGGARNREEIGDIERNGFGGNGNILRTRLLQSESFTARYQVIFQEVHDLIYQESFLDTQIEKLSTNFSSWNRKNNLISQQSYQQGIERLEQTIAAQASATASSDISQAQSKK